MADDDISIETTWMIDDRWCDIFWHNLCLILAWHKLVIGDTLWDEEILGAGIDGPPYLDRKMWADTKLWADREIWADTDAQFTADPIPWFIFEHVGGKVPKTAIW